MHAIVQDGYGPPERLALREIDQPVPTADQALVRVRAASLNAYDWHMVRGDPRLARLSFGLRVPNARIRGRDFAGVVEAVGTAVTSVRVGDEVYGEANGAFAEYLCVSGNLVERKPANLSFEQAAAIPLAGNTALMGIRDAGRVQAGQRVLVNGASGGVGPYAIQLARSYGAEVTAVCSSRNVEVVQQAGADHVIDYTREDFTRGKRPYDVVLDLVGNRSLAACRRILTPDGTLVLSGGGVFTRPTLLGPMGLILRGRLADRFVRQRILVLTAMPNRANLITLRELAEAGALRPIIDRTYPLARTPEALHYLESEHARAKVVITI